MTSTVKFERNFSIILSNGVDGAVYSTENVEGETFTTRFYLDITKIISSEGEGFLCFAKIMNVSFGNPFDVALRDVSITRKIMTNGTLKAWSFFNNGPVFNNIFCGKFKTTCGKRFNVETGSTGIINITFDDPVMPGEYVEFEPFTVCFNKRNF